MDSIATVHGHIAAGDVSAAMQLAQHLLDTGQPRVALDAFYFIAEAYPAEREACTAFMADAYAALGDFARAHENYQAAGALGAPAQWVSERLQWLAAKASAAAEVYIGRAARDPGWWNQKGLLVLRAAHLVFLPTEKPTHVAAIAAKAFLALGGVLVLQHGGTLHLGQLEAYLRGVPPGELDSTAMNFAAQLGGVVYRPGEARYRVERLPLGTRVSFSNADDRIMALKPAQKSPVFGRLAATWPVWT